MAKAKDIVKVITLKSEDGKSVYQTVKNTKNTPGRITLSKFHRLLKRHMPHTEVKK